MRYQRNPAVESAPMQQEVILFEPVANTFCLLNGTAAFLWDRLEHPATADELATALCGHYQGVDTTRAAADVETALAEFSRLAIVLGAP